MNLKKIDKEDSERQQQRNERFFTLMERMLATAVTTTQPIRFSFDRVSAAAILPNSPPLTPARKMLEKQSRNILRP